MKTYPRFLTLVLVALFIGSMVAGCGAPAAESPPVQESAAPPAGAEPTSLDFVVWSYGIETIQDNIKNFQEANPECKINLQDYSWLDYHDTMVGRFAGGNPPPLLYGSDHWLQEWAAANWLEPLDPNYPQVLGYSPELAPYALQGMTFNNNV